MKTNEQQGPNQEWASMVQVTDFTSTLALKIVQDGQLYAPAAYVYTVLRVTFLINGALAPLSLVINFIQ